MGEAFDKWKRSMTIAFFARNKLGLAYGSLPKLDSTFNSLKSWSRCNETVNSETVNSGINWQECDVLKFCTSDFVGIRRTIWSLN